MHTSVDIVVREKPDSGVSMNTLEQGIYVMSNWGMRGGTSDEKALLLIVFKRDDRKFAVALEPGGFLGEISMSPIRSWDSAMLKQNQLTGDRGYFTPITGLRIEATIGNQEHAF